MCGIAGLLSSLGGDPAVLEKTVELMCDKIAHRGPDGAGCWVDPAAKVALGHRRLSIIDTSRGGAQPMVSNCGRYVLSFNGEIYNFRQIRSQLESQGETFRGTSDTEVLLTHFAQCGFLKGLPELNGMFAFGFWDREQETLWLGRDRVGEKPLYYGLVSGTLAFASELKAFSPLKDFVGGINRQALALFLRYSYVPSPYSIYENIRKLEAGCVLSFSSRDSQIRINRYWEATVICAKGLSEPLTSTSSEIVDRVESLLSDSVSLRMVSDVPLGAFLSGGIDSSLVVALMQSSSIRPVKTFTLGCHEWGFSELDDARAVARHLGTEHTELIISSKEALEIIPQLPKMYDEPFADSSQIPTHIVSKLARQSVTVCLSGDGGDEVFGGYNRYVWAEKIWRKISPFPFWFRRGIARIMQAVSPSSWNLVYAALEWAIPTGRGVTNLGDKIHKVALAMQTGSREQLYRNLTSQWHDPSVLLPGVIEPLTPATDSRLWLKQGGFTDWMMHQDMLTYLPDDILAKVDRASMAVGLECRVPFLDPRLIELSWKLPHSVKIREGTGKWVLRQMLARHIPSELFNRPKMGFSVPIDEWLRGPLRDWAEELLSESRLSREGVFEARPIRRTWLQFLENRGNLQHRLWPILMYQAWFSSLNKSNN